jgi:hypothetical protein
MLTLKKLFLQEKFLVRFFLLATIIIYLSFSLFHLSQFMTVDEQKWIFERTPKYWRSWMNFKPSGTLINDKPGISVALISGFGLLAEPHPEKIIQTVEKHVREYPIGTMEKTLFYFRFPIVLFNGLAGWLIFWLLKKFTGNDWLSLWSTILILLSPPLIGISQIVNPDSLLWTFSILSLLALANCLKTLKHNYALLSVLTLGLSIGSKYTAFILYPFFTLLYAVALMAAAKNNYADRPLKATVIRLTALFSEIIFGSLLFFSFILPAIYFKTDSYFSQKTIAELLPLFKIILLSITSFLVLVLADSFFLKNKILLYISRFGGKIGTNLLKLLAMIILSILAVTLINWSIGGDFLRLERVPFDALTNSIFENANLFEKTILEFRPLVFSLTPVVALFFVFILCLFITRKFALATMAGALIFFIFLFHTAMIYNNLLTTIRYSIIIYPLICILSAMGIWEFRNLFFTKIKLSWISFILLFLSCASLASVARPGRPQHPIIFHIPILCCPKNI